MTKNSGSGLIEYVLPIGLIGLVVGIGLYQLGANTSILNFITGSIKGTHDISNKNITVGHNDNVSPTIYSQNPTNTTPTIIPSGTLSVVAKSNCTSGSCDIDFGSFTLTAVPENFGDYVRSNGTSGGVDSLASLIMQIANQIEPTDPTNASDIRDLANLGHFMAQVSNANESIVSILINGSNDLELQATQYSSFLGTDNGLPLPANLQNVLPLYNSSGQSVFGQLGKSMALQTNDPAILDSYPGAKFQSLLNKINSSSITADQKNVVQKLASGIDNIMLKHYTTTQNTQTFINLANNGDKNFTNMNLIDIVAPQTSVGTNIRSALICKTGKRYDNGSECNL